MGGHGARHGWPGCQRECGTTGGLAAAAGSLRHDLALKEASREPAGRGLNHCDLHAGGADLVGEYKGRVVLMWRGGCSFTDKVRRAQQAGAAACIVVQTAAVWPFTMSDSKMQVRGSRYPY